VVRELVWGKRRFNGIHRGVPLMSSALLAKRLRTLEDTGVIERRPVSGGSHEYHLTEAGEDLQPLVEAMAVWGQRWVRWRVAPEEIDPGLLMWEVKRNVMVERLPEERVVVYFAFRDAPRGQGSFWLVLVRPEPDLCLTDPGFGVDLTVRTDAATMAHVWLGDFDLAGRLQVPAARGRGAKPPETGLPRLAEAEPAHRHRTTAPESGLSFCS
jgi:DNA-binding HxlR family transcriptional regulator